MTSKVTQKPFNEKWVKGQTVKVNKNYTEFSKNIPVKEKNGKNRSIPKAGDIGVIYHVDRQGDAWADFDGKNSNWWVMNPSWADVIE